MKTEVDDPNYTGHKPCPRCGSKDNVYRYPDGHEWCFGGCGYHKAAPLTKEAICALLQEKQKHEATLPASVSQDIPDIPDDSTLPLAADQGLTWLKKYGITDQEIRDHSILWSQSQEQLIFPIFNDDIFTIAWHARNFKPNGKKYLTYGKMDSILHILGLTKHQNTDIIIVEDMVSAIKVSRHYRSMPLFGSGCSKDKLSRVCRYSGHIRFWLDRDKLNQSIMLSKLAAQLGVRSSIIYTELDPKEHSDEAIRSFGAQ